MGDGAGLFVVAAAKLMEHETTEKAESWRLCWLPRKNGVGLVVLTFPCWVSQAALRLYSLLDD